MITILEAFIFVFHASFLILAYVKKPKNIDVAIIYFLVFSLAALSSVQYLFTNPNDYSSYARIYKVFPSHFMYVFSGGHEVGFNFFAYIFSSLNVSYEIFIFTSTLIFLAGISRASLTFSEDKALIFLSIICTVIFFNLALNLYRQALAVSIVLIALFDTGNRYKKIGLLTCACFFHISALVILPFLVFQNNRSRNFLFFMALLSLTFFLIDFKAIILSSLSFIASFADGISYSSLTRVENNALKTEGGVVAYRSFYFLGLLLIFIFAFSSNKVSKVVSIDTQWILINYFSYCILVYGILYRVGSFSRLGIYAFIILPIVLYVVLSMNFSRQNSKFIILLFAMFSLFGTFLVKNVYFAS